jgi:hypothetical protein
MNDLLNDLVDAVEQFSDELIDCLTTENTVFEPLVYDHLELH